MPENTSDWAWWVGGLVSGIALNVLAAFVYAWLGKRWRARRKARDAKRLAAERELQRQVEILANHPTRIAALKQDVMLLWLRVVQEIGVLLAYGLLLVGGLHFGAMVSSGLQLQLTLLIGLALSFVAMGALLLVRTTLRQSSHVNLCIRLAEDRATDRGDPGMEVRLEGWL